MDVFLEQLRTVLVLLILLWVSVNCYRTMYEAMKEPEAETDAPLRRRTAAREPSGQVPEVDDAC